MAVDARTGTVDAPQRAEVHHMAMAVQEGMANVGRGGRIGRTRHLPCTVDPVAMTISASQGTEVRHMAVTIKKSMSVAGRCRGRTSSKRIPGLKFDHPRQIALMHALLRFAHVAAGNTFSTIELLGPAIEALGC